jgi:hypothetical protein
MIYASKAQHFVVPGVSLKVRLYRISPRLYMLANSDDRFPYGSGMPHTPTETARVPPNKALELRT